MRHLILLSSWLVCACAASRPTASAEQGAPDLITFAEPDVMPEGLTYNPRTDHFLVSSAKKGQLGAVSLGGEYRVFADDPSLLSTLGTHVDPSGQYVVTAVSDIGVSARSTPATIGAVARLVFFDLATGQVVRQLDLASLVPNARHFANDFTWDDQGNLYLTDSYAGVIYRVSRDFKSSVFSSHPSFALTNPQSFGLNGIVFDARQRALVVAKLDEGKLFKVSLDAPEDPVEVKLPQPVRGDGLLLRADGSLIVAGSFNSPADTTSSGLVSRLTTRDGWRSATLDSQRESGHPSVTTVTERRGELFVNHAAYFATPPVRRYDIVKVTFPK